jgi:AcrR family transcriptional regulator
MRALAGEAECAIGLPYKVFTDRHELVVEVVHAEFDRLRIASEELLTRAATGTVSRNLTWYAEVILDSPAVALAPEIGSDQTLSEAVTAQVHNTGIGPGEFETAFAGYLAAEQRAGRVAAEVDTDAFGFLLAGAIHNLIMSGDAWPQPTRRQLQRRLAGIAAAIAPSA